MRSRKALDASSLEMQLTKAPLVLMTSFYHLWKTREESSQIRHFAGMASPMSCQNRYLKIAYINVIGVQRCCL